MYFHAFGIQDPVVLGLLLRFVIIGIKIVRVSVSPAIPAARRTGGCSSVIVRVRIGGPPRYIDRNLANGHWQRGP